MGIPYRSRVFEGGVSGSWGLEEETCNPAQFLGPETILRLVEYMCRGKPMSAEQAIIGSRYLIPLLAFVNGVEWTFVFLRFTGHLR
jgi:hypothetical protein